MRGTPCLGSMEVTGTRIIPADAGNTCSRSGPAPRPGDHPRGCGEHQSFQSRLYRFQGSSPRMRGTLDELVAFVQILGIIPADAGNTHAWRLSASAWRDHPRGCGEHFSVVCWTHSRRGSSPRMRGTLIDYEDFRPGTGIIPADAGNTLPWCSLNRAGWDHPRGCGEHKFVRLCSHS